MIKWGEEMELKARKRAGIEEAYLELHKNPSSVATMAEFKEYVKALSKIHQR